MYDSPFRRTLKSSFSCGFTDKYSSQQSNTSLMKRLNGINARASPYNSHGVVHEPRWMCFVIYLNLRRCLYRTMRSRKKLRKLTNSLSPTSSYLTSLKVRFSSFSIFGAGRCSENFFTHVYRSSFYLSYRNSFYLSYISL